MSNVLLIIQLIISVILTGLILIQRSEGGALGIGGGGGGGFMSGRSATTSIARMTGILGAIFIVNCLALSVVFNLENQNTSILDDANEVAPVVDFNAAPETENPNILGTNEEEALTEAIDSTDTTLPLADETSSAETPENEAASEAEDPPKSE